MKLLTERTARGNAVLAETREDPVIRVPRGTLLKEAASGASLQIFPVTNLKLSPEGARAGAMRIFATRPARRRALPNPVFRRGAGIDLGAQAAGGRAW